MFISDNSLENILQKVIFMSSKLIRFYPRYASLGIVKSQIYLRNFMKSQKWDEVMLEPYRADDLKKHSSYVKVSAFGDIYSGYENFKKYNLIALINSGKPGPNLILNGHVDVDIVDEEVAWNKKKGWRAGNIQDKKLFGRGATDMLSGLSALIQVANYLKNNKNIWCGKIILKSVMDEEIGGNGTLSALLSLQEKKWLGKEYTECIIAEPTENKLCTTSLGFLHLKFCFLGNPLHMGIAQKSHNALNNAIKFINNFDIILEITLKKMGINHLKDQHRYNFGIIKGGIDSAIPIENLELEGTIFYPVETNKDLFIDSLLSTTCKYLKRNISLKESGFSFSGATFGKTTFGKNDANYAVFPSPCDARLYKEFGIPTTIFGPGSLFQAHSINEYIEIKSIKEYIKILLTHIINYFQIYD